MNIKNVTVVYIKTKINFTEQARNQKHLFRYCIAQIQPQTFCPAVQFTTVFSNAQNFIHNDSKKLYPQNIIRIYTLYNDHFEYLSLSFDHI